MLAVGGGLGEIDIDLEFLVQNTVPFSYRKRSPFAYLTVAMENRAGSFFYGVTANGFKFDGWDTYEEQQEYKVNLGYRLHAGKVPIDLLGGWRHMRLKFRIDNTYGNTASSTTRADIDWKGPFLGVAVTF